MHFQNGASCLAHTILTLLVRSAETSHTDEGPGRALDPSLQTVPALTLLCGFGKTFLSCKRPTAGWQHTMASPSRRHWQSFWRPAAWMMPGRCTALTMLCMLGFSNETVWSLPQQGSWRMPKQSPHATCSLTAPVSPVFHVSSMKGRRWVTYLEGSFDHAKTLISHLRSASALQPNTRYIRRLLLALSPSGRCNSFLTWRIGPKGGSVIPEQWGGPAWEKWA